MKTTQLNDKQKAQWSRKWLAEGARNGFLVTDAKVECGKQTLGPDDLIRPCIREEGHEGFCSTGR